MTQSQKDFEAWAKSKNYNLERWGDVLLECWQASRAALVVELPQERCDAGERLMNHVRDELDSAGVNYK